MSIYASQVASHLQSGAAVLEVAPGPGLLSIALAKMADYRITGMDISADFVRIAAENARQEDAEVDFVQGNVSAMSFESDRFDFIVCSAAFKNFSEPLAALNEMCRVLKPGSTALIIDMNRAATAEAQDAELERMNVKGFDRLFVKFSFRTFLRRGAYTKAELDELLRRSDFGDFAVEETGMSLYVYAHK